MPLHTTARVEHGHFVHEETFISVTDAYHWQQMMKETLAMPEAAALDPHVFAVGLAATVRMFGGAHARDHWLIGDAGPERWARGLVVPGTGDTLRENPAQTAGGYLSKLQ